MVRNERLSSFRIFIFGTVGIIRMAIDSLFLHIQVLVRYGRSFRRI
jgi:hypothetical protein